MAQIKKLQPGGTAPKSTYGRLIQNGKAIEATDDMLNWLDAQGYYGQQMASAMRSGNDQYIDTDEQGVGWIKNIAIENPELKEKQQTRSTQAARRLEGRRLREARNDIQRLATYDYGKFASQPKEKSKFISTLNMDINEGKDGKGNITYSFSPQGTNLDILKRIADIEAGLDPETYSDAETINRYYQEWSKKNKNEKGEELPSVWDIFKQELQAGNLSAASDDVAYSIGVISPSRAKELKKTSGNKGTQEERDAIVLGKVSDYFVKHKFDKDTARGLAQHFDIEDIDGKGVITAKKSLTDKFGQNYWFTKYDEGGFNVLDGHALINGRLVEVGSSEFNRWKNSPEGQEFINNYNQGNWQAIAGKSEGMKFKQVGNTWNRYNSYEHYNPYFRGDVDNFIYRDVSSSYNIPQGYVGMIETLDKGNGYLYNINRYYIKPDGSRELYTGSDVPSPYQIRPSQIGSVSWANNELVLGDDIKLSRDAQGNLTIYVKGNKIDVAKLVKKGYINQNDVNNQYALVEAVKNLVKNNPRNYLGNYDALPVPTGRYSSIMAKGGIFKHQPGGTMAPVSQNVVVPVIEDISDPTKSLKNTEFTPFNGKDEKFDWNQLSSHDKAELASLGLDAASLLFTIVPGYGNIAGAVLGLGSTVANTYANQRDGFQFSDIVAAGADAGLTLATLIPGAGSSAALAKLTKGVVKAHKVIAPVFIGFGLVDGYQGLQKILSGEYDMRDVRAVANGLMSIRGIIGSKMSNRAARKYGVELDADGKPKAPKATTTENPIDEFLRNHKDDKDVVKTKKEIVDKLLKDHPELKKLEDGTPTEWVDKDDLSIKSYEKAWEGLREKSSNITDEMILNSVGWKNRLSVTYQKVKDTAKKGIDTGIDWFKRFTEWFIPADPTTRGLNPELDPLDLKSASKSRIINSFRGSAPDNWTITHKKGGKIKKCQFGDRVTFDFEALKPYLKSDSKIFDRYTTGPRYSGPFINPYFYSGNFEDNFTRLQHDYGDYKDYEPQEEKPWNPEDHDPEYDGREDPPTQTPGSEGSAKKADGDKGYDWDLGTIPSVTIVAPKPENVEENEEDDGLWDEWNEEHDDAWKMDVEEEGDLITKPLTRIGSNSVTPITKSDLSIPRSTRSTRSTRPRNEDVQGGKNNFGKWLNNLPSILGPGARFATTYFTNKRVLDLTLDGIRKKYLGAMKSMPISQPLDRYNLNPMISTFDRQKADARIASQQIGRTLSDQKLQVAQNLATESKIAQGEQDLLDKMSKHITEVDLANTMKRYQYAKDEQTIADYNRQLGGQQAAEEADARAQFTQKTGDNFNRMLTEITAKHDKYLALKDRVSNYTQYADLMKKYDAATSDEERKKIADDLYMFKYMLQMGENARNPFTGASAFNV